MIIALVCVAAFANPAFADGCNPGDPCYEAPPAPKKKVEVIPPPAAPVEEEEPVAAPIEESCSGWGSRIAAGVPVWFFQEEDTEVGGGIYSDVFSRCFPLNFRVGAEVAHIGADQENALESAEFPGKPVRLTFVRIPFAVEYHHTINDNTHFFIGGGPDIIRTANDVSDTTVGLHLSGRLLYELENKLGFAVEAGYMWGEVSDDGGGDIDLDNTFIIPQMSYRF